MCLGSLGVRLWDFVMARTAPEIRDAILEVLDKFVSTMAAKTEPLTGFEVDALQKCLGRVHATIDEDEETPTPELQAQWEEFERFQTLREDGTWARFQEWLTEHEGDE